MSKPARGTLAVVAALAGLLSSCGTPKPTPSPATGRRVVLLGLDAADWLAIDPLVDAGRLPAFARLRRFGRTGVLLATPPLVSPIVWTTIATGRQPEDHGVLDFMTDLPGGGQAPVGSDARRTAALWNIFSAAGRSVAVVGFWATAPAEAVRGTLISDRVAPQLLRAGLAPGAGAVFPPDAWPRLSSAVVRPEQLRREDLQRYAPLSAEEFERARAALLEQTASPLYRDRFAHLAAVVAGTRTYGALAERLLASGQPDLLAVYLEAVDTTSHLFVRSPHGAQAIAEAYRDADALLARLASAVAADTLFVVCSDHGFQPADAGLAEDPAQLAGPATAWHRPYGIVAVAEARALRADAAGPAPGPPPAAAPVVTPLDLAPTVLFAAGLPVGSEMPGRVAIELLPIDVAARPVLRAPTPARPPASSNASAQADPDAVARLQALGYLGATPTSLARQNLGESLFRRGKLQAAERELRATVAAQPGNLAAHLWLAQALRAQGHRHEALRAYAAAVALPGGADAALVEAVELALDAKRPEDARALLAAAPPDSKARPVARAVLARSAGRPAEALRELHAALARDPADFAALARLFDLLVAQGHPADFLPDARRALAAAPSSARVLALSGEALLAVGRHAAAEEALARALALAPDSTPLRLDLARAQIQQRKAEAARLTLGPAADSAERQALLGAACATRGDWPRAAEHYRAALEREPDRPAVINGLAWALEKQGRHDEARLLFERSLALDPRQDEIRALLHGGAARAGRF